MSNFSDALALIVVKEIAEANGDKKKLEFVIDRLTFSIAQAIVRLTDGDTKMVDGVVEIVTGNLYEGITRVVGVDESLKKLRWRLCTT